MITSHGLVGFRLARSIERIGRIEHGPRHGEQHVVRGDVVPRELVEQRMEEAGEVVEHETEAGVVPAFGQLESCGTENGPCWPSIPPRRR